MNIRNRDARDCGHWRCAMRAQKFAPMTKNFATFDCDAHVSEPPWLWDQAKDCLSRRELAALEETMWYDSESSQLIVNGRAGMGAVSLQRIGGAAGKLNLLSVAGPGLKHDLQRTLNVRNVHPKTA